MSTNAEKVHENMSALKDEVAALRDKLAELLGEGTNGEGGKSIFAELGRKGAETAKREIEQRPLLSALLFFVVGLVLGRMLFGWLAVERK